MTWKTSRTGCYRIGVTDKFSMKYPNLHALKGRNLENQSDKLPGTMPDD